ncbi:hypothetical protein [Heyndrickxia vini]|uniref:Uncharacterized protein n=1 Tax=Heyndrickxia vini TaxID=1476025 RepID=A0ABX7E8J0_9BACI|nr:hypothetical protein [Heyndrickxia vini]QQZ11644.1 hypothetical protein I5776_16485 [Heyndrickxia vini]
MENDRSEQMETQKKKISLQEAMKQQLQNKKGHTNSGNSNKNTLPTTKKMKSQQTKKTNNQRRRTGV